MRAAALALAIAIALPGAAMACAPRGSAERADRDFRSFLDARSSLLRPGEADALQGLYADLLTSLRRSEGECAAPTPATAGEALSRFGAFYESIGPGGRAMFDGFTPPFQDNPWQGGRWVGWVPSTGR